MSAESSFGMLAKNRRRELGLTQDELARRVGCAPITLRKIEADDLRPSVQIAERMAMALNIPLEERSAFVKLARIDRTPVEEPRVTPMPAPEEIGSEDLSGRAIRGYALGERLGNGGMGAVYRAIQPLVEREVAIKIILPKYANHPDFIRRFEAEAQLVARLEHPHIVPLYDYWREPGVAYLIMRLLRGGSVQTLLRNGSILAPETVLRMMEQVGSALSSAHRAGIVHRDLKPANVLLDEDNNAYLADFGIAKNLSSPASDTQADAIIGSLDYISPEQIRSEYVRPQTDIYAFGVMLYELLTGKVPFQGPTPFDVMHQHLIAPLPPLAANRTGLPKALDDVIEHATAKEPLQRYETVESMLNDLRKALGVDLSEGKSGLIPSQPTVVPLTETDNPYKGLRAFGEGDAQDFFGREALTQQLLVRLGEGGELSRFLAVVGPSGSGKSSVVKAGLIPALRRGALPGSENWFIIEMMPGSHPLEELEAALLRVAVNPPASLIEQFQKDSRGLIRAVRRSLPDDPDIEVVLVIDQFEEMFTLLQDETERLRFLGLLVSAVLDEHSRIRVVLTLRADFIDRPLGYVDFGELLHQRMEIVLPLTPDELESAIVSPAERVGLHLESGLVSAILHDLGDQPGTLPLLQYALTELYEKRDGNTLTKSAYQNIGGVLGALGRRAEEIFTRLDAECQEIAKQLFLRLVTLGEGVEDTRRRALIFELENLQLDGAVDARNFSKSFQKVLNAFGSARLLSFDRDPDTRGPTVEVAHEAIIREWARLRTWLNESRALVRMQRQLAISASEWKNAHHDDSFLLTGTKLAQYEGWTVSSAIALTQHELAYLKAGIALREEREASEATRQKRELEAAQKLAEIEKRRADEQTLAGRQLRKRGVFLTAASFVAVILAVAAMLFGQQANQNRRLAASRELAAASINNQQVDAERSILLALQALSTADTLEARNALHQAIWADRLRVTLAAHSKSVFGVAGSSDGQHFATAGLDGTVKIWKLSESIPDQNPQLTLSNLIDFNPVEDAAGETIAFAPNGKQLAAISEGKTVKVWDVSSGQLLHTLTGHGGDVYCVAFSPDGKYLATGSDDSSVKVWDTATGRNILTLTGHSSSIYSIAFSPNGNYLVSAGFDSIVKIWNLEENSTGTSREITSLPVDEVIQAFAFSPDRTHLAMGVGVGIQIWSLDPGAADLAPQLSLNLAGHDNAVIGLSYSPDGERLISGGVEGNAKVWDANTGQELFVLAGGTGGISSIALTSDGSRLLTANVDGTLKLWDLTPAGNQEWFNVSGYNGRISADGQHLIVNSTGLGDDTAEFQLWDISPSEIRENRHLSFDPGGMLSAIAYLRDLDRIATVGVALPETKKTLTIWDANTGQQVQSFLLTSHTDVVFGLNFSPDGSRLATGSDDGTARVWDAATGKELFLLTGHTAPVRGITFSPDGARLATGSYDGTAKIWDAKTGQLILNLSGHEAAVIGVAFSPDGKLLATTSNDKTAKIWDAFNGKAILTLKGHASGVFSVTFSSDGRQIATGSFDGTTKVWNVADGQEQLTFSGMRSEFTPNGKRLITFGVDGIARGFFLEMEDLVSLAKSRLTRGFTTEECQKYLHMDVCPVSP